MPSAPPKPSMHIGHGLVWPRCQGKFFTVPRHRHDASNKTKTTVLSSAESLKPLYQHKKRFSSIHNEDDSTFALQILPDAALRMQTDASVNI